MPKRMLDESAFTSDKISSLSDFEYRVWTGLITYVDDAGRGDARPAIIKGRLFALRERVTVKDIGDALNRLAAKGCVSLYTVGGKPYFWFPKWEKHQRIRDVRPKYPGPDEADNLPQYAASCGNMRPESESNTNPNTNPNTKVEHARAPTPTRDRFVPPTVEQIAAYVRERNSPVDPQEFYDFYAAKGWMVGKNKMKDWRAACRNAEKWDRWNRNGASGLGQPDLKNTAADKAELERMQKIRDRLKRGDA